MYTRHLDIPCVALQNMVLSKEAKLVVEGKEGVRVTSSELGVRSNEPDGVKTLGVICDNIVDSDASDPIYGINMGNRE